VPTSYNNFFNGEEGNTFVNNPARFSNDCEVKAAQDKSTGNQNAVISGMNPLNSMP
jgi:hypothetical protein